MSYCTLLGRQHSIGESYCSLVAQDIVSSLFENFVLLRTLFNFKSFLFLMTGTPFAALTGTAESSTISVITDRLLLQEPLVIQISPNRENVGFCVLEAKKDNMLDELTWLVNCVRQKGHSTPKTIIFCNTMNDIACIANHLKLKLGEAAYFPVKMIASLVFTIPALGSTTKKEVVSSLKGDGKIRIVIASTALSMGVNFPDIRYIINWGPATDLLDQHQEIGRAGRNGLLSHSIIMHHGQQLSHCEQAMKDFVRVDGCLRIAAYQRLDPIIQSVLPPHNCYSFCSLSCKCAGTDCDGDKLPFEATSITVESNSGLNLTSRMTRPLTTEDQKVLE